MSTTIPFVLFYLVWILFLALIIWVWKSQVRLVIYLSSNSVTHVFKLLPPCGPSLDLLAFTPFGEKLIPPAVANISGEELVLEDLPIRVDW